MLDRRPTVQREIIQRPLALNTRFYADSGLSIYATAQNTLAEPSMTVPQKNAHTTKEAAANKQK